MEAFLLQLPSGLQVGAYQREAARGQLGRRAHRVGLVLRRHLEMGKVF